MCLYIVLLFPDMKYVPNNTHFDLDNENCSPRKFKKKDFVVSHFIVLCYKENGIAY